MLDRKTNEESLGEVIKRMITSKKWQAKIRQHSIALHWQEIMGNNIARKTDKIYLRGDKLYIIFSSASLKHEMLYLKEQIKKRLNDELGENIIEDVIIK